MFGAVLMEVQVCQTSVAGTLLQPIHFLCMPIIMNWNILQQELCTQQMMAAFVFIPERAGLILLLKEIYRKFIRLELQRSHQIYG